MISVYQELKLVAKIIVICNFLKVSISMWDPMWIHSENNWSELKTVYKYICFLFCSTMHCQIINLCSVLKTRPAWIVLKYNFRLSSLCNTLRYPVTICYQYSRVHTISYIMSSFVSFVDILLLQLINTWCHVYQA